MRADEVPDLQGLGHLVQDIDTEPAQARLAQHLWKNHVAVDDEPRCDKGYQTLHHSQLLSGLHPTQELVLPTSEWPDQL